MTNIKQITPDFQSPLLIFYFAPSFPVIASRAKQSQESKTQKSKGKMTEQSLKM